MTSHRKTLLALCMSAFLVTTGTGSHASASSDLLQQYRSLCARNALCSSEDTDRGLLFRLRMQNRTEKLLCQNDGACEALLPRSNRYRVEDANAWFLAR
ncbi:MAG: hypothetical protein JNM45_06470 [Rhizobiales bacterium]|nr:hypothetical protein [Hyphomicrobiales bacterium]